MEATTRFTAPELVALAKRAARDSLADAQVAVRFAWRATDPTPYLRVRADGKCLIDGSSDALGFAYDAFNLALTPENITSEDALAKALVASRVTFEEVIIPDCEGDDDQECVVALLGDTRSGPWGTNKYALQELLDALMLAPTEAPR
jgi:hypothetical protein